jgi:predicted metal-dependent phosphoesterase TrpH
MIDLHSHTTASDGELSPEELLARARAAGVTTRAVTDHDTVKGLARARAAADAQGIRLVPGIEVSTEAEGREIHILGHFVDPTEPELTRFSDRLQDERAERMGRMVERMNQLGFPVTLDEVERIAAGAHIGRPHLALALVERGYVTSTREAFDRFLGDGKPGYVSRFRVSAEDAIAMLHRAGGTATLAHPGSSKVSAPTLERLVRAGLDGLEIFHPDHVPSQREAFLRQAETLGLVPTAGSDFHGPRVTPDRKLGMVSLDPAYLARLEARATTRR